MAGPDDTRDGSADDTAVADTLTSGEHATVAASLKIDGAGDRYQLLELLGRGGMGEVHKAFDPQLGRYVALKLMRGTHPDEARRLIVEARAQARVEHPHVCKVYGVGELDGMPFIALQYVEGATLREMSAHMTREERVAVLRDVAEALHAAHRQGLVHRDVKPTNILVEGSHEKGGYKAYVTDFGLAREVDAPGLTKTGVAQGTPLYMAPEQARGETHRIDRRTDVYGLGVMLYELLAGRRPFEGSNSLGVLLQVLDQEPPPLRSVEPSVPVDLETITMKCLEKDPARRYESARALAEDLAAWLNGDPIQARRQSFTYRLAKRARKHVALLAAGAIALVAATMSGVLAWQARRSAAQRAHLAQVFGQEVARNDAIGRYAALLPLHDTRREHALIEERMKALAHKMAALGAAAEGPGRYALGRGWLVLERPDEARRELERAWQAGFRTPEVSYALGLALVQAYERELAAVQRLGDREVQEARREELARRYRDPALAYLKGATSVELEAPEYVEGLIALYEGRYPQALEKAQAAHARVPWLFEAWTLEGDIHLKLAKQRLEHEPAQALAEAEQAGEAYRAAYAIAHSSASALHGDCLRFLVAAELHVDRDEDPAQSIDGAVRACGQAAQARPDEPSAFIDEAEAYLQLGRWHAGHMGDPARDYATAETLAGEACRVAPEDPQAQLELASVYKHRANWAAERGDDPSRWVERGLAITAAVIAVAPRLYQAHRIACDLWTVRGDWEGAHGGDPRKAYDTAVDEGEKALAISSEGYKSRNTLGIAWLDKGMWELGHGLDPRADLARAIDQYQAIARNAPSSDFGWDNLCATWQTLAEYQTRVGIDPMSALGEAVHACEKSITVDPNWAGTHLNLGCAHFDIAVWQREQGIDPGPELTLARAALDRALALDHGYEFAHRWSGEVAMLSGRWAARHGQSPLASYEAARASLMKAMQVNARSADTLRELAELERWIAEWHADRHEPVEASVRAGLERAAQALAVNPRLGAAALQAGALHLIAARTKTGEARREEARAATASLARALELDANLRRELQPLLDAAGAIADK